MKELEEMIKDYDERISFKERRIAASLNISDYKACDELKDGVMELKKKKRELEAEVKRIAVSNRQSTWYQKKKSGEGTCSNSKVNVSGSSSTSSEPMSPLAYESSSDLASSSESVIGAEASSVPRAVSESPVFGSSMKSRSRAGSVSPVFGSSKKPHSRAGSVSPVSVLESGKKTHSRAGYVSPVFSSTQKHSLKHAGQEPARIKPGECSRGFTARSSISSSPQSPDTCVVLNPEECGNNLKSA